METFVLLTLGPVSERFSLPPDVQALASKSQLDVGDRVMFGERYLRLSSRKDGDDLGAHVDGILESLLCIVRMLRAQTETLPIQLGCVVYGDAQNGVFLSEDQVAEIATLRMSLDFQAYNVADNEE